MMGKQIRKPSKKGPPFDTAQLTELAVTLGNIGIMLAKLPSEFALQEWADLVNRHWRLKKEYLVAGFLLAVAKRIVPHGQWGRLFKKHPQAVARPLRMSDRTAERLIRLARHPTLRNSAHGSNLPSSWRTLAELAQFFAPSGVEYLLANGRIHPKLTRAEVSLWIARMRAPKPSPPAMMPVHAEPEQVRKDMQGDSVGRLVGELR